MTGTDFSPNPTQPIKIQKFLTQPNPTQSNPWVDPTHGHVWYHTSLAVEIDIQSKPTFRKTSKNLKLCLIVLKRALNTNQEPWSNFRMVTSLPVHRAPVVAEIDKSPYFDSR
jgi:hypothetical protein